MYFDKDGTPISDTLKWAKLFDNPDYKRVAKTTLPNGRFVSTVWLGLNHQFGDGPPLLFETMVFPNDKDFGELDSERYSTESEARAGHQAMVDKWRIEP